jgi:hypothetical protein
MVTKNDFNTTDWNTLRNTQFLVGFATVMAGASGLGTVKELFALSQGIIKNQASDIPLIRDLTSTSEMEAAQTSLKQSLGGVQAKPTGDQLRQQALEQTRAAMSCLLRSNAGKEETDAYRRMLYGIAENVANAAREGGFLGFGGTQVSAGESSFLAELRDTLQLEQVSRA